MPRKESWQKIMPVARRCAKSLRAQERPVDCGDTRRRFRHRTRASGSSAPAAATEADARPGEETARESLRRRERSASEKKCQMSQRLICAYMYVGR